MFVTSRMEPPRCWKPRTMRMRPPGRRWITGSRSGRGSRTSTGKYGSSIPMVPGVPSSRKIHHTVTVMIPRGHPMERKYCSLLQEARGVNFGLWMLMAATKGGCRVLTLVPFLAEPPGSHCHESSAGKENDFARVAHTSRPMRCVGLREMRPQATGGASRLKNIGTRSSRPLRCVRWRVTAREAPYRLVESRPCTVWCGVSPGRGTRMWTTASAVGLRILPLPLPPPPPTRGRGIKGVGAAPLSQGSRPGLHSSGPPALAGRAYIAHFAMCAMA